MNSFLRIIISALTLSLTIPAFADLTREEFKANAQKTINSLKKDLTVEEMYGEASKYLTKKSAADLKSYIKPHRLEKAPTMKWNGDTFEIKENNRSAKLKLVYEKGEPAIAVNNNKIPLREISDIEDLAYRLQKMIGAKKDPKASRFIIPSMVVGEDAHAFNLGPMVIGGLVGMGLLGAVSDWDQNKMILGAIGGGLIGWFGDQKGWWNKESEPTSAGYQ